MQRTYVDPLVFALPRGGVPVAAKIAAAFKVPLEVLVVRKIGAPGYPEYGIGAIAEDSSYWLNERAVAYFGYNKDQIQQVIQDETLEIARRIQTYRGNRRLPAIKNRAVILVDDGLATGATAQVACDWLKAQGASSLTLAIPVGSKESIVQLRSHADEIICLHTPDNFSSVGQWYHRFDQTTDDEVIKAISLANKLAA